MAWWDPQMWDWATMAKTAVGAGFGTVLVQGLLAIYQDSRRKKSDATYLAMWLSVILEDFVIKCVNRAWHDDASLTQGATELNYNLPELADYPTGSEWKSLDFKLAGQVLSLRNEITAAGLSCEFQGTRENNHIASGDETVVAGLKAWKLAQTLRKKYDLGAITIQHVDFLENATAVRLSTGSFAS